MDVRFVAFPTGRQLLLFSLKRVCRTRNWIGNQVRCFANNSLFIAVMFLYDLYSLSNSSFSLIILSLPISELNKIISFTSENPAWREKNRPENLFPSKLLQYALLHPPLYPTSNRLNCSFPFVYPRLYKNRHSHPLIYI